VIDTSSYDYGLTYGSDWQETIVLYSDPRVKRWRGDYNKNFLYLVGDGVLFEGAAYVALLEDARTDPGPDSTAFWSPVAPFDLTGYVVQIVCDAVGSWGGFTTAPSVAPLLGRLNINIPHTSFAEAPSSAHWYLKITEPGGAVMEPPIHGTLLFKAP
jgi:hypothetical protein